MRAARHEEQLIHKLYINVYYFGTLRTSFTEKVFLGQHEFFGKKLLRRSKNCSFKLHFFNGPAEALNIAHLLAL